VQNAVVWVEMSAGPHEPAEEGAGMLDQRECVFEPHVLLTRAGGTITIRNPDPVLHNVRIFQERTMLMHEWQQPQGPDLTWRFDEPGRYLVRCGVHSWMHAWIVVAEHEYYALTDSTGGFTIPAVPQGDVIVHAWHETLGEHRQRVTVIPGQSVITIRMTYERGGI
jgi:plastocyanin